MNDSIPDAKNNYGLLNITSGIIVTHKIMHHCKNNMNSFICYVLITGMLLF